MGERKVLNKYYPPDFDPREVPRKMTARHFKQITIRTMLPMSIRCSTCAEFVYMGRKFNARQERAPEHDYLGIRVFRQYIKCPGCKCEIIIRTDPKNSDYVVEAGATRNFEPWKQKAAVDAVLEEERVREDREDSMKALENRTLESKREMDRLDALEEIRELNRAQAKGDASEKALERLRQQTEEQQKIEQERLHAEVEEQTKQFFGDSADAPFMRRISPQPSINSGGPDSDSDNDNGSRASLFKVPAPASQSNGGAVADGRIPASGPQPSIIVVSSKKSKSKSKKKSHNPSKKKRKHAESEPGEGPSILPGADGTVSKKPKVLVAYASSSSDSDF